MGGGDRTDLALFVTLEPPLPLETWIQACRTGWKGVWRADIPPTLGLAGPLEPGSLELPQLREILASLARVTPPLVTSFSEVRRFPDHSMIYLEPTEVEPLLHARSILERRGVRQALSPFSRIEHLTIAWFEPGHDAELEAALSIAPPPGPYRFDHLALYTLDAHSVRREFCWALRG